MPLKKLAHRTASFISLGFRRGAGEGATGPLSLCPPSTFGDSERPWKRRMVPQDPAAEMIGTKAGTLNRWTCRGK